MYTRLFDLPPSDLGLIRLQADQSQVAIQVDHGITYFISVMALDSYGQSVGREIYPFSNELKVSVP
jgi:hypothetical protein